ncbi:hypothetical protein D3C79_894150 [compost metagenome]
MPDVAGVLDHLGDFDRLADHRRVQALVQRLQQVARLRVQLADHGHGREVVVLDRGAFTQEFGVDRHAEVDAGALARALLEDRDDHVLHRAGQHGTAHHHGVAAGLVAHGGTDFAAHRLHVDQVQVAVLLAWGTDAQQRHLGGQHRGLDIRGATQAAVAHAIEQQLFQAGFDDG